jgi:hypothetical protein
MIAATADCATSEFHARIELASRRDVAVADDARAIERRVTGQQCHDHRGEHPVLHILVGRVVGAFQLDADGKIVAAGAALELRQPRVPGPRAEGHELHGCAVAPYQDMRRDPAGGNGGEVRMCLAGQRPGEQLLDPRSAVLARRQTDAMDHDEVRHAAGRTGIKMRRQHLPRPGQQTRGGFDVHRKGVRRVHATGSCQTLPSNAATHQQSRRRRQPALA